jgi:hypothetical protein
MLKSYGYNEYKLELQVSERKVKIESERMKNIFPFFISIE